MKTRLLIAIPLVLIAVCTQAAGQEMPATVVEPFAGTGAAQMKRPADRMVVWIPLRASGADVRAATKMLQQKVEATVVKLKELGVEEKSIVIGSFAAKDETTDASRRMMQMQSARSGRPSVAPAEDAVAVVTVTTSLRGNLALTGTTGPEILASASDLQEAIRNAKLTDDGMSDQLSPEQQEILEETQMFHDSDDEENSTEPAFIFTAVVTPQERSALFKKAFQNAEAQALELAEATGAALGPVGSVRHDASIDYSMMSRAYGSPNQHLVAALSEELQLSGPVLQMIGDSPAELTYSVHIIVGFSRR